MKFSSLTRVSIEVKVVLGKKGIKELKDPEQNFIKLGII